MRLVTLELSYLLGTGTVSKSGSVRVRTCVDSEGFWPAQFCVQFRADCHDNHTGGLKRLWEDNIISSRAAHSGTALRWRPHQTSPLRLAPANWVASES
jgi:hypothetical protein